MAQLNSLLVTGDSRFLNPINGNARNGIYYVKGTQTAATGAWTGNIPVPALYDGLTICYYLPYAGSGNATLNLTLSTGTTTSISSDSAVETRNLRSGKSIVSTTRRSCRTSDSAEWISTSTVTYRTSLNRSLATRLSFARRFGSPATRRELSKRRSSSR